MSKVRKKFIAYAMAALFVLLTVLLGVINGVNFTMAAQDADQITALLSGQRGEFRTPNTSERGNEPVFRGEKIGGMPDRGPMGPDSPETRSSVRYFTVRFDGAGNAETVAFHVSAFTEDAARELAQSLVKEEGTGWVRTSYRYRVYRDGEFTYVTVIDQGRELHPSFRILIISLIGEAAGLIVSFLFLSFVGKKLFHPLEEADRKQKKFLSGAEKEFKVPLTVVSANVDSIERAAGGSEDTASIRRQVKQMTALTKKLSLLELYDTDREIQTECDLSGILTAQLAAAQPEFEEKGLTLDREIQPGVKGRGDPDTFRRVFRELIENALKYARGRASFSLKQEGGHAILTQQNGTELPDGDLEAIFDRFTVLSNAPEGSGRGLGLAFVRDAVRESAGRVTARAENGTFTLTVTL